ncbi:hypothetical protein D3C75_1177930 [compost metagenome]
MTGTGNSPPEMNSACCPVRVVRVGSASTLAEPLSLAASSTTLNRKFSERNWPNSALPLPIIEAGSRGVPSGATPSNRPSLKPPPLQRLEEPKSRALKRTLRFLNRLRCISATLTSSITC